MKSFAPRLELLEQRRLLAGNVQVDYDAAANTINVKGGAASDALVVTGMWDSGYTVIGVYGTRFNGAMRVHIDPRTEVGGHANLNIDLGKGDDAISLDNFVALNVRVQMGQGNDGVFTTGLSALDGLSIETGKGDDVMVLGNTKIHNGLNIETGSGNDQLWFIYNAGVTVLSGNAVIKGGPGVDHAGQLMSLEVLEGTTLIENFWP
jgi:hypothetical protein